MLLYFYLFGAFIVFYSFCAICTNFIAYAPIPYLGESALKNWDDAPRTMHHAPSTEHRATPT
jgi:hypothetical protein